MISVGVVATGVESPPAVGAALVGSGSRGVTCPRRLAAVGRATLTDRHVVDGLGAVVDDERGPCLFR